MIHTNLLEKNLSNTFEPKCIQGTRFRALSAQGYVLPCCWIEFPDVNSHPDYKAFFDPALHIGTIEDIGQIEQSDQWQEFFKMLRSDGPKPDVCRFMCGSKERNRVRAKERL